MQFQAHEQLSDVRDAVNLDQAPLAIRRALADARNAMIGAGARITPQVTPERIGQIIAAWTKALYTVRVDAYSSNAIKEAAERALREDAAQALKDLRTLFDGALAKYRETLTPLTVNMTAEEAERTWRRLREQIEAGVPFDDILADAKPADLTVLTEELTAWQRAKMPGDVRSADHISAGMLESVAARRYDLASDSERKSLDRIRESEKGAYYVTVSFAQAESALTNLDAADDLLLVGWDGKTFNIPLMASGVKLYL